MKYNVSFLFWLVKNRQNKAGRSAIYARLTVNGKRSEVSTNIFVELSKWDTTRQKVKGNDSEAVIANQKITTIKNKLEIIYLDLEKQNKVVTAKIISDLFNEKDVVPEKRFLTSFKELLEYKEKKGLAKNSLKVLNISINNLNEYLNTNKKTSLLLSEVNQSFFERYICYLETSKKHCKNHIAKQIGNIKECVNFARRKGELKGNPLEFLTVGKDKAKPPVYLTESELKKLIELPLQNSTLIKVRDLFLLQCNTGFAYIDLQTFDFTKHVVSENNKIWIKKQRQKSDEFAVLPLFEEAGNVLNKYKNRVPLMSNGRYNLYLKEIADLAGINKVITTHVGRKTAGMIWLNKGFSIESVAQMLGHSNIKTTQSIYAKVLTGRISREMENLDIY